MDTRSYGNTQYNQVSNNLNNFTANIQKDISGNTYTTSVSNDQLTTSDFLKLMLQSLKLQDPTTPMDSKKMMDTQVKISTMNTNLALAESMKSLVNTFNQTALANASTLIGKDIESKGTDEYGVSKAYKVLSVETQDGQLVVKAAQILYLKDILKDKDGNIVNYDKDGYIYKDGKKTSDKIELEGKGKIKLDEDQKPIIKDENDKRVLDTKYKYEGDKMPIYGQKIESIPFNNITKIFS